MVLRSWQARPLALYTLYTSCACVDWIERPLHAAGVRRNEAAARPSAGAAIVMRTAAMIVAGSGSKIEIILGAGRGAGLLFTLWTAKKDQSRDAGHKNHA